MRVITMNFLTRNIDTENVGGDNLGQLCYIVLSSLFKPLEAQPASAFTFLPGQLIGLRLLTKTRLVTLGL